MRGRRSWLWAGILGSLLLAQTGCIPLPVRVAPAAEGVVVDAASGEPLADVLVVVRFDGRYDDVLPDRELLGHRETRSDALGRFRVGPLVRPGLSAWPLLRTEARVVGALRDGYRCAAPQRLDPDRSVRIALEPVRSEAERRESCRPVPAERGEATAYMTAWRALYPEPGRLEPDEPGRPLERMLEARAAFGFGANCEGPVTDLALAPGGARAALTAVLDGRPEIRLVELASGESRVVSSGEEATGRLAWSGPGELVRWTTPTALERVSSASVFGADEPERVWSATGAADRRAPRAPLDPADLNDERDTRWLGRSFALRRDVDPETGLSRERLEIGREDGSAYAIDLPGEACGARGRFGRPHHRIAADGRSALDLRFVEGGCHAVAIDLETGHFLILDGLREPATCEGYRRIPATQLSAALRGYVRDLEESVREAGADPASAYVLHVEPDGNTRVETRDFAGEARSLAVAPFPISTPLRRIDVSVTGSAASPPPAAPSAIPGAEPL